MDYKRIASELKESITEKIQSEPYKVIVYGSFTRNEENRNSDLDVILIFNKPFGRETKDIVYEIITDLNLKYEIWIDVSFLSLGDMNTIKGKQPYVQNALHEGIEI